MSGLVIASCFIENGRTPGNTGIFTEELDGTLLPLARFHDWSNVGVNNIHSILPDLVSAKENV